MQILALVFTQHFSFELYYNNCSEAKLQTASVSTDFQESFCDGNKSQFKSQELDHLYWLVTCKAIRLTLLMAIKIF